MVWCGVCLCLCLGPRVPLSLSLSPSCLYHLRSLARASLFPTSPRGIRAPGTYRSTCTRGVLPWALEPPLAPISSYFNGIFQPLRNSPSPRRSFFVIDSGLGASFSSSIYFVLTIASYPDVLLYNLLYRYAAVVSPPNRFTILPPTI